MQTEAENLEKMLTESSSTFRNKQDAITIRLHKIEKIANEEVAIEFVRFQFILKMDRQHYLCCLHFKKNDSAPSLSALRRKAITKII
ncbi:MAG: hypothetical protein IPQ06_14020 [Chitinophagaceae bacterium]|nr:hypothetical protein [Chitinophagaceae bacterium]